MEGMGSRDSWLFELQEGDTIQIFIDVRQRSQVFDEIIVSIETVEQGTLERWTYPKGTSEISEEYTAYYTDEHTLRVVHVGIADVIVVLMD